MVMRMLEAAGEPWLWSIHPDELGRFLEENNWRLPEKHEHRIEKFGVEYFGVAVK